jgi:uncharacterized membrane protein required for colicin V production
MKLTKWQKDFVDTTNTDLLQHTWHTQRRYYILLIFPIGLTIAGLILMIFGENIKFLFLGNFLAVLGVLTGVAIKVSVHSRINALWILWRLQNVSSKHTKNVSKKNKALK